MRKRNKEYKPRFHPRTPPVIDAVPGPSGDSDDSGNYDNKVIDYEYLSSLFNITPEMIKNREFGSIHTPRDLALATAAMGMLREHDQAQTELTDSDLQVLYLVVTQAIYQVVDKLSSDNFDIINNPNVFTGLSMAKRAEITMNYGSDDKVIASISGKPEHPKKLKDITQEDVFRGIINSTTTAMFYSASSGLAEQLAHDYAEYARPGAYQQFRQSLGASAGMLSDAEEAMSSIKFKNFARLFSYLGRNPSSTRRESSKFLQRITDSRVREFVKREVDLYHNDWFAWSEEDQDEHDQTDANGQNGHEIFTGQEVDFTVLPAGTAIRDYAEELYGGLSESDKARVDMKRLGVLEKLRDNMGPERCFYVHGKPVGTMLDEETGQYVGTDYLGLVIQTHDTFGRVVGEDAIAISPIAKKHAGYIFRHDINPDLSWRGVLSLPKPQAREKGARPLKFTQVAGWDMYEAYTAKAMELLTCPVGQFGPNYELRIINGSYVTRKRRPFALGGVAAGEPIDPSFNVM